MDKNYKSYIHYKIKKQKIKTLENFINEEKIRIEKELIKIEAKRREKEELKNLQQYKSYHVYHGSNGAETRKYLNSLEKQGHYGKIAAALFRTQKSSTRAKMYHGGKYTDMAYEKKNEVIQKLCSLLNEDSCGLIWGWGFDKNAKTFYDELNLANLDSTSRFARMSNDVINLTKIFFD